MQFLRERYARSPEFARIAPFAVFVLLTALQGEFGPTSRYWLYLVKTLVGAWMLWEARPYLEEMRWKISLEAVVVGIGIAVLWVGLDGHYPRLSKLDPEKFWDPTAQFGSGSVAAWFYIVVRLLGPSLVVPPIEELFYRSFLYRYLVKIDFRAMPFRQFHGLSFVVTSVLFGVMHPDRWVGGIICGLAYQWLVIRKDRLGDAMTAHAITNLLLGVWVVWKQDWSFW